MLSCSVVVAAETPAPASDTEDLKRMVDDLQKRIKAASSATPEATTVADVQSTVIDKFADGQEVTTHTGKLTVGGLMQVWYQHIQNDKVGIDAPAPGNFFSSSFANEPAGRLDNDTFRIRRMELRFGMEITEHIFAYVMIDPSREANGTFTPFPTFPLHNGIIANPDLGTGNGTNTPSLLQDAFIEFHDFVPHHEFRIGQFKPPSGEESWRESGNLDFVDRSLVASRNNVRDIGVMMHGGWFETKKDDVDTGRVQYWAGLFNGPRGTVLTDPELQEGGNRSDDNDKKDLATRILVRPLWEDECWVGKLELGYARTDGSRGEGGRPLTSVRGAAQGLFFFSGVTNALNEYSNAICRQSAWASYKPNGCVKGLWLRGEWGSSRDRLTDTNLLDLGGNIFQPLSSNRGIGRPNFGNITIGGNSFAAANGLFQGNPQPLSLSGFYLATGFKLSESRFAECLDNSGCAGKLAKNFEFAFRFETFQNVVTERGSASGKVNNPGGGVTAVLPTISDQYSDRYNTQVYTTGINYYIKGNNAKLQANYAVVVDPERQQLGLRDAKNNQFVLNFQVGF